MKRLNIREITLFAILGALMFAGKKIMEFIPNVHPLTLLTVVYTVVFRRRGIFPVMVYLLLESVFGGFVWSVPYYYIFPLCYLLTLLVPKGVSRWKKQVCYTAICTFFGIAFGCLYAPWQAVMWGLSFEKTLMWIAAGFTFDIIHAVGNFALSFAVIPLANGFDRISNYASKSC